MNTFLRNIIHLFLYLENFISNDSNSCVILDDDDDDDDIIIETNSKPVNNIEQSENSIDDDCYCVDITDS